MELERIALAIEKYGRRGQLGDNAKLGAAVKVAV
jgi:hypothetical protein